MGQFNHDTTSATGTEQLRAATIGSIVRDLGAGIVSVVAASKGLDVQVSEVVVDDRAHPPPIGAGDLVLAVGTAAEAEEAVRLVTRAAECDACGVVLKSDADLPPRLAAEAESRGVALLTVPVEMAWGQFVSLLRTTMAAAADAPGGGKGAAIGDLFALANAVSAMVGAAVTIEDPRSRVLAYSSLDEPIDEPRRQTILGRQVPQFWLDRVREAGVFRKLWSTEEVVRFEHPADGLRPRLAVAVRAGSEVLGSIWVAEGRRPFDDEAEAALREAARVASLHLMRHSATEDLERRMRGDLLRSVLEGRGPVEVVASRLGVDATAPFTVIGFELQSSDEQAVAVQRERTLDLIALYCEAFRRRAAAVAIGQVVYALLPTPDEAASESLERLAKDILDRASESLGVELRAGVGTTVQGLWDVPLSRREADQALRVLQRTGNPIARVDDVRGRALLIELEDLAVERPHLRMGRITKLVEHDRDHGSAYVETLRAYLDAFGDVPTAAGLVNVHPNTFRYRLRRLTELSGIDLHDAEERLAAEIQLRFI